MIRVQPIGCRFSRYAIGASEAKNRLWIIINDSKDQKPVSSSESQTSQRLMTTVGTTRVKRQHMSNLQHNRTLVIDGKRVKIAICGSTNFTWQGQFVQANNALVVRGRKTIQPFLDVFDYYWAHDLAQGLGSAMSTD